ncbi:MAG: hypothetical protein ACXWV5_11510, partial [Flavitalea sp.]
SFSIGLPPVMIVSVLHSQEQKKPTWRNTRRYSTTSAYSSTNPPAQPGCFSASHPTTINCIARNRKFHSLGLERSSGFIGNGGNFEGKLINSISPDLASVPTHYGKSAQNAGFKQKLKESVKVMVGQKLPRQRFDKLAKNFSPENEGGRFLMHLLKESPRFAEAWQNIQNRFPDIQWKNIHFEFPSMVNAAMVSLILQGFDKKIDYSS